MGICTHMHKIHTEANTDAYNQINFLSAYPCLTPKTKCPFLFTTFFIKKIKKSSPHKSAPSFSHYDMTFSSTAFILEDHTVKLQTVSQCLSKFEVLCWACNPWVTDQMPLTVTLFFSKVTEPLSQPLWTWISRVDNPSTATMKAIGS